jgi:DNA modification methylase
MIKPYYEENGITIYHGDCREILPELEPVDLVLTDPPYGIYASGGKWGKKYKLQWDKEPFGDIESILSAGKEAVIWGGNYYQLRPSRGWLVWHKRDRVITTADVELAWTSRDMNARLIDCTIAQTNPERTGHPTQKPLKVIRWSLSFFPDATTVLDPFMGSGTTLRAAKDLHKKAIGIEIEEKYCEIAVKRLAQGVLDFAS